MTQTLKLTHEQQRQYFAENMSAAYDVVAAAKAGAINSINNFYFFAAFDGTGNTADNSAHGNDYPTNVWDIWNTYTATEISATGSVHGDYEEGPGTPSALPYSGAWPQAVYQDGLNRAEAMYAAFVQQATAWINDPANSGKTFDPQIAEITFSRGDDSTVIFSQLLYERGLVIGDKVIKMPGEIKISAAVIYDPVTTGMDENLAFAPIDTNVVALDAKNEYRINFTSTSYAAQSNIVKEFDFWGNHSDIGGGYAYERDIPSGAIDLGSVTSGGSGSKPIGQSGTGSITEQAAVDFLINSGLPDLSMPNYPASLVAQLQEKSIEVHREDKMGNIDKHIPPGLSNSLLSAHLAGSGNSAAIGGDLAYFDGMNGNLTGLNMAAAVSTLQGSTFGKGNQTIDPWASVSGGVNTLH